MDRRGNRETEHRCGEAVVDAKCYVGNHALVRTETDIRWDAVEVIGHLLNTAMFSSWNFFFFIKGRYSNRTKNKLLFQTTRHI